MAPKHQITQISSNDTTETIPTLVEIALGSQHPLPEPHLLEIDGIYYRSVTVTVDPPFNTVTYTHFEQVPPPRECMNK